MGQNGTLTVPPPLKLTVFLLPRVVFFTLKKSKLPWMTMLACLLRARYLASTFLMMDWRCFLSLF